MHSPLIRNSARRFASFVSISELSARSCLKPAPMTTARVHSGSARDMLHSVGGWSKIKRLPGGSLGSRMMSGSSIEPARPRLVCLQNALIDLLNFLDESAVRFPANLRSKISPSQTDSAATDLET